MWEIGQLVEGQIFDRKTIWFHGLRRFTLHRMAGKLMVFSIDPLGFTSPLWLDSPLMEWMTTKHIMHVPFFLTMENTCLPGYYEVIYDSPVSLETLLPNNGSLHMKESRSSIIVHHVNITITLKLSPNRRTWWDLPAPTDLK